MPIFFKEKRKKNSRLVNHGDIFKNIEDDCVSLIIYINIFKNIEDDLCISHHLYKIFSKLKELLL